MKSKLFASLAATALLHAPAALAQDSISMKIDMVAWGPAVEGLTFQSGAKGEPITAQSFTYSKPVSYSGPVIMQIHKAKPGAAAAVAPGQVAAPIPPELAKLREKDPTIVALAKLPPNSKRATVLIAPAAAGTYQTVVIDDDPSKLPFGQLRIHNYSPVKIAMRCNGKAQKELKTKDTFLVTPNNASVIYELAYDEEGKWVMQENNIIPVPLDEQVQLIVLKSDDDFFTSSDGSRSGFLQAVTLRRPAKEETPTQPPAQTP